MLTCISKARNRCNELARYDFTATLAAGQWASWSHAEQPLHRPVCDERETQLQLDRAPHFRARGRGDAQTAPSR